MKTIIMFLMSLFLMTSAEHAASFYGTVSNQNASIVSVYEGNRYLGESAVVGNLPKKFNVTVDCFSKNEWESGKVLTLKLLDSNRNILSEQPVYTKIINYDKFKESGKEVDL